MVLQQNETYGNLIAPNGSEGKAIPALYRDIQDGKVSFAADGDPPGLVPQRVQIGVSKIGQESRNGVGAVIVKGEPELVLDIPRKDSIITETPEMPKPKITAQLKNYGGGLVRFGWILNVKWITPQTNPTRFVSDVFHATTEARGSSTSELNLSWDNKIRGGDQISLYVIAFAEGKSYQAELHDPFKIVGKNPTVAAVKDGLSPEEQVVVYMESSPKWKHFSSQPGYPIFGKPHGYGLMQIDNPQATDEEIWNWMANKIAGKNLLAAKRSDAQGYASRIRRKAQVGDLDPGFLKVLDFDSDELLWKETFQRYNGGGNWYWQPDDADDPESVGEWMQKTNTSGYGIKAWNVLQSIQAGNPPTGW